MFEAVLVRAQAIVDRFPDAKQLIGDPATFDETVWDGFRFSDKSKLFQYAFEVRKPPLPPPDYFLSDGIDPARSVRPASVSTARADGAGESGQPKNHRPYHKRSPVKTKLSAAELNARAKAMAREQMADQKKLPPGSRKPAPPRLASPVKKKLSRLADQTDGTYNVSHILGVSGDQLDRRLTEILEGKKGFLGVKRDS